MHIILSKHGRPQLELSPFNQVASLMLEHRVLICDGNELLIAEAFCICNISKVRISLFAVFADNERIVDLIVNLRQKSDTLHRSTMLTLFSLRKASGLLLLSM